jgi:hypothetical protein
MAWRNWQGTQIKNKIMRANFEAAQKALEVVGEQSDQEVPHRDGILMRSKHIRVELVGSKVIGIISYGGGPGTGHTKVPYAIRWHETPANFQKGRKSNYLRDPFNKLAEVTYKAALKDSL